MTVCDLVIRRFQKDLQINIGTVNLTAATYEVPHVDFQLHQLPSYVHTPLRSFQDVMVGLKCFILCIQ